VDDLGPARRRLVREALLLLVFASRPTVEQALLDRLTRAR